jgi:excinuclease UvrABC nuclease subunit
MNRITKALMKISGVTEAIAEALVAAGYDSKAKVLAASETDLKKVPGITAGKATGITNYKVAVLAKRLKIK